MDMECTFNVGSQIEAGCQLLGQFSTVNLGEWLDRGAVGLSYYAFGG